MSTQNYSARMNRTANTNPKLARTENRVGSLQRSFLLGMCSGTTGSSGARVKETPLPGPIFWLRNRRQTRELLKQFHGRRNPKDRPTGAVTTYNQSSSPFLPSFILRRVSASAGRCRLRAEESWWEEKLKFCRRNGRGMMMMTQLTTFYLVFIC